MVRDVFQPSEKPPVPPLLYRASLSMSSDGSFIAAGVVQSLEQDDWGQVRVFRLDEEEEKLNPVGFAIGNPTREALFGSSIDISDDGKTLAIGGPGDWRASTTQGNVYIYTVPEDTSGTFSVAKGFQFWASFLSVTLCVLLM